MSETTPGQAPEPPTAHRAEQRWIELRIHGVSGTPPEVMLESAHVRQVAGDSWGRFFRPDDGVGREVQTDPRRILEGYHWGRYTSGSWLEGLWLILIPFGLVNAAAFMVPHPGPGSDATTRRVYAVVQALIRGIGIGVTCTFALAAGLILVDLVAWQWAAGLPWIESRPSGPVMTVGVVLAGLAVYGLYWLGDRNRISPFGEAEPGSLAAEDGVTGMMRPEFFRVDPDSSPVLGRFHLSAAWSVVALIGALTWQTIDGDNASHLASAWQHVAWSTSLVVLVAVTLVVTTMGDPDGAAQVGPPSLLRPLLPAISVGAEILSGLTLVGSALVLAGTDRQPRTLDFDRYTQWLATGAGAALLLLAVLLAALAVRTRPADDQPRMFRRFAGGMAAWGATSTGVFLGVGFCGAFVLGLAKALGVRAQTELIYRVAFSWGLTLVLVVAVAAITAAGVWRTGRRMRLRSRHEYDVVTGALGAPPDGWVGTIARAMSVARLKLHIGPLVLTYGVAGLLMTAVTSVEMLGESGTPWVEHWYDHLGWFGYLSQRLDPVPAETPGWVTFLTNLGTYVLISLAGLLYVLGRRSLRAEGTRRGANVVWDVISFWPHSAHPFVPPSYAQFAVHDLRRRIDFHLNSPARPPEERPTRVVVSAHSQGSLIAFATMLWLGSADRERTALVTYGSQLQVAYPRGFPSYVDRALVERVQAALGHRWINLYRETDPIAGPVLSWDRSAMEPGRLPVTSHRVGEPDGVQDDALNAVTGRRESGDDWRVLDPPPVDPERQLTPLTHLSKHSGFPASADYRAAVQQLHTRFDEPAVVRIEPIAPVEPGGPEPEPVV
ncbi:MAG TPA: hypothetical protein VGK78_13960 [Nocardioides sp.]|uniref:hypothetical protein n=1 Tax=Nocardioides sp. TaxID=35761 RepID=UPI002F3F835B